MNEFFTKKEVKKISCLTQRFCKKATDYELTEVIDWGNGEGYDIIISENFQSVILSLSKEHFAMIKEMVIQLEQD